ncbi:MAG: fumarylacetoacetase, partial [Zoogloea sp.]|nr:fumarylacetoacetase [Zoogloea sp.]
MSLHTDPTHDPALQSWVASANSGHTDFPIQNLPYGRFRRAGTAGAHEPWRIGIAIGDQILDLAAARGCTDWPTTLAAPLDALAAGDLNTVMAAPKAVRVALRQALSAALRAGSPQAAGLAACLVPQAEAQMALPCAIADYT